MNDAGEQNVTQPAQEVVTQPQAETPPWEQQTQTSATEQGTQATTPNDQEEQRKAKGGFQQRINELVREREYERAEKQRLHDLLARQTVQHQPQTATHTTAQAPQLENFQKYEDYLQALTDFRAEQIYEQKEKARQERETKAQSEARQREAVEQQHRAIVEQQKTLNKLTSEAEKRYPDFYEKVFEQAPDVVPISPMVGQAILESDQGMDVAYYLGTHPAEAQRIAKLSPTAQLREFGKLEVSLKQQKSAAPAPINPVTGKQSGNDSPNANDNMKDWIAKRNRQMGRK